MKRMLTIVCVSIFAGISFPLCAGMQDQVEYVYSCNDDVGIQMRDAGWVVALQSEIGPKRVDRILAIATTLLVTQKPTGYFNERAPISWCGIAEIKPITVLGALK